MSNTCGCAWATKHNHPADRNAWSALRLGWLSTCKRNFACFTRVAQAACTGFLHGCGYNNLLYSASILGVFRFFYRRRFHAYGTADEDSPGFPGNAHTRKRVPAAHPAADSSSTIHMVLCKVTSCCTLTWRYLSLSLKSPIFPGCLGNSCPFWVLLQRLSREIPARSLAVPLTAP